MKLIKTAAAFALSTLAFAASAMTPIQDADLSAVSGQDGVSIAANLNVNIGSFTYTDTDKADPTTGFGGGSVSFNGIKVTGLIAATLDIVNAKQFGAEMTALGVNVPSAVAAGFHDGTSDVVKIAIPNVGTTNLLNMSVDSIKMGNSTASYGSFAMKDIDLRGTAVYIWAH
ncbi:DUF6160 family protein [Pseudoduganella ginsengisoli]|uniref:DUF6160 domain-containing protein n=1 Tax=Pseudoduganella ginsengisoli TaxID=1462440 RepID=A0A6L6Q6F8_9BURK|nr:DUF6160 family protein [Pseudoduganella ginsengisoli]MTW05024.1 hypothetical protein [Pseudoduganella ginsengisoli]